MKLIFLIKSLLASRKRFIVLISASFVLTAVLLNVSIAMCEEYYARMSYIERNRYTESMERIYIQSYSPLTDEYVDKILTDVGLEKNHRNSAEPGDIPLESSSFKDKKSAYKFMDDMVYDGYFSNIHLCKYSEEFSTFIETAVSGEIPDKDKNYDGYIPVIAGYGSGLNIGSEIKSNYYGTKTVFKVVGKYSDDSLEAYFSAQPNMIYTDEEIMYKAGLEQRPEDQPELTPSPEKEQIVGEDGSITIISSDDEEEVIPYLKGYYISRPDGMTPAEFRARIEYLSYNEIYGAQIRANNPPIKDRVYFENLYIFTIKSFPMFLMIFIISTLGVVGNLIVNADSNISNMAVFRLCGAKIKTICLLTAVGEAALTLPALAVSLLICGIFSLVSGFAAISVLSSVITTAVVLTITLVMIGVRLASVIKDRRKLI